jgi:hypothetical protein
MILIKPGDFVTEDEHGLMRPLTDQDMIDGKPAFIVTKTNANNGSVRVFPLVGEPVMLIA